MYRKNKLLAPKWLKKVNGIVREAKRYGKRAERLTGGIVRTYPMVLTHSPITEDALLQPLLIIMIELINEKKCKDIGALIEILKGEGIQFTHVACAGHHDLKKVLSGYKAAISKLKELIAELLDEKTTAKKEVKGT